MKLFKTVLLFLTTLCSISSNAQSFEWVKTFGSPTAGTFVRQVLTDASGDIFLLGSYQTTTDFDPSTASYNLTASGNTDIYLAKFNSNGTLLWVKSYGGTGLDEPFKMAIDNSNNIYVTGYFEGTADFDPSTSVVNKVSAGGRDPFLLKLNSSGDFIWVNTFGSATNDYGKGIALDASGNIYLCGNYENSFDIDPSSATLLLTSNGSNDNYLAKFDPSGNLVWGLSFGSTGAEEIGGLQIAGNNIYIAGSFEGTVDFDPSSSLFELQVQGFYYDAFVAKYTTSGSFQWAKKIGGNDMDACYSLSIDPSENIYMLGTYIGTADLDPSGSSVNVTSVGEQDTYFIKLNSQGDFLWGNSFGCSLYDYPTEIRFQAPNSVFVVGAAKGIVDFDPSSTGKYELDLSSYNWRLFMAKYNSSDGSLDWAHKLGGNGDDIANTITTNAGNIYVAGNFNNSDFDLDNQNTPLTSSHGDVFFSKYYDPSIATSISDVQTMDNFSFYPNPCTDIIYFTNLLDNIQLIDSKGIIVLEKSIAEELDISNQAEGIYLLKHSKGSFKISIIK